MTKKQKAKEAGDRRRWRFFPVLADEEDAQEFQEQFENVLDDVQPKRQSLLDKYKDYPLVQSMLAGESTRNRTLIKDGRKQGDYVQSNGGWIKTLLVIEGRALDNIWLPWTLVTINAIVWTMLNELVLNINYGVVDQWEFFIGIVLNTSLSFLLVFRLNRAAERFWLARGSWGNVVADIRHLVSGIEAHGGHDPKNRDCAVSWVAAFPIATMQYMRGITDIPLDMLAGVLDPANVKLLASSLHPPLYASDRVRAALTDLFLVTPDTKPGLAHAWSQQMDTLEKTLNVIMDQEGAMERIRSTPLPLVYVTHLRIFLLVFLFSLPYIWYPSWRWSTIPIVFITSFAMLGLEGAAIEVECPFRRDRPNHLDMDKFCMVAMSTIQQTICDAADRDIKKKTAEFAKSGVRESVDAGDSDEASEPGGISSKKQHS